MVASGAELLELLEYAVSGARDGDDVGLPHDAVEVEYGDGSSGSEAPGEHGLAEAGVAEDSDAHGATSLARG